LVSKQATQQSVHPTLGIRRHFQAVFYASAFFQSDGVPPPTPARVTQTVRRWLINIAISSLTNQENRKIIDGNKVFNTQRIYYFDVY
jgi:hypothetical protein